ncbi:23S rRNA pseudouridine(2604) synthase [Pandoraea terrae]|uniref:Dual-specificity RNA pseudouridine synthase RluF n=1 Tax=Pandoraea terrae TaxID=1537710 RepID=A0A5E4WUP9_9BURK|nr:pseudouridine synthase [Pandoraea terrae]VVE26715.1 23S rRNA pseudouridine(2604) synthase [Pandoraea terrae]
MSDTPRAKLGAKHPRNLDKTRAPVRPGALRRPTKAIPAAMLEGAGAAKQSAQKPPRARPAGDAQAGAPAAKKPYGARAPGTQGGGGARTPRSGAGAGFEGRPKRTDDRGASGAGGTSGAGGRPRPATARPPETRRFGDDRDGYRRGDAPARPQRERVAGPKPPRSEGDFARPVKRRDDDFRSGTGRGPRRDDDRARNRDAAPPKVHADAEGMLRLSKRMSELGLCSRREADEWIAKGWVRVDGKVIAELGAKILPDQEITVVQAARNEQAQRVTILLNKPVGYVSGQAEDGYEPAVVLLTRDNHWSEDDAGIRFSPQHLRGLAPAGRLDIDSTGLLVLTQDGRVARQLIGEDSDTEKEYLVRVSYGEYTENVQAQFPAARLALLRHGLELDEQALKPAEVDWQNPEQLRFVLKEGKKRQIRRMCELVGLHVTGLKRVRMGRIALGNLPAGQWRYLRVGESF